MIMCCMKGIVCSDKPTENYQLHAAFEHLAQLDRTYKPGFRKVGMLCKM